MQGGVGSSGRRKGGLHASHSKSCVCWAGFDDLRPKAASPRGTPREGSGSLSPHGEELRVITFRREGGACLSSTVRKKSQNWLAFLT